MSDLERGLERLAPSVATGPGIEDMRLRRRRRRIGWTSLPAVLVAIGVGAGLLIGQGPDREPVEVTGTLPSSGAENTCALRLVDRVTEGPVGVVLQNDSDTACWLPAVTGAGQDEAGVAVPVAVVPIDDAPARETPTLLAPDETISVVVFNRPWPCPDDGGLVEVGAQVGDREIALSLDGPVPQCGVAIAVVDGVVAAAGSVGDPDDPALTPCELEYSLRRAGEVRLEQMLRVSFVNVADWACALDAVGVAGMTATGESAPVAPSAGGADSEPALSLPAVVEPGAGIAVVLFYELSGCLDSLDPFVSIEATIGDKVVDIVPGLDPEPWSDCGLVFSVVAEEEPWFGVPGDPTESRGQICRLSYPAQCDDPFIRVG